MIYAPYQIRSAAGRGPSSRGLVGAGGSLYNAWLKSVLSDDAFAPFSLTVTQALRENGGFHQDFFEESTDPPLQWLFGFGSGAGALEVRVDIECRFWMQGQDFRGLSSGSLNLTQPENLLIGSTDLLSRIGRLEIYGSAVGTPEFSNSLFPRLPSGIELIVTTESAL